MDRSWLRRGIVSPAPWARSVPDVWADTLVTFARYLAAENDFGGFGRGASLSWDLYCVVGLQTETGITTGDTVARVRRYYEVICDMPDDVDLLPRKGDRMIFTDPAGRVRDMPIKSADLPENLADHVEIQSEEFE